MASRGQENMFQMLKSRFPHLDLAILNPELTFSENLQTLVSQLGLPPSPHISQQITNMKDAVDNQELKIQKSLVNEEDVLGSIINRGSRRQRQEKEYLHETAEKQESSMEEENNENLWRQEQQHLFVGGTMDMLSDIWEFGSHQNWFHH